MCILLLGGRRAGRWGYSVELVTSESTAINRSRSRLEEQGIDLVAAVFPSVLCTSGSQVFVYTVLLCLSECL